MTADRPAPDTDALARVIVDEVKKYPQRPQDGTGSIAWGATEHTLAAAVLAAVESDPDVQAAVIAALTRGGALDESVRRHYEIATFTDDGKVDSLFHGADHPGRLREALTNHPSRYPEGAKVVEQDVTILMHMTFSGWREVE